MCQFLTFISCCFRRDSHSKVLWDEQEINVGLRSFSFSEYKKEDIINAVEEDDRERFESLITALPSKDKFGAALLISTWKGNREFVKLLLDRGADPSIADPDGRTCLHLAACSGDLGIIELLIEHGANVNAFDKHRLATPLFCAAVSENSQSILVGFFAHLS